MPISRRDFLKSGAAAIAGFTIAPSSILGKSHGHISPTDKLNIGVVGIGGIGHSNINAVKDTENIVALCDVNWDYAKGVFDEFPKAKRFWDYRKMYEEMGKSMYIARSLLHTRCMSRVCSQSLPSQQVWPHRWVTRVHHGTAHRLFAIGSGMVRLVR